MMLLQDHRHCTQKEFDVKTARKTQLKKAHSHKPNSERDELTFNASDNDVAPESPILL